MSKLLKIRNVTAFVLLVLAITFATWVAQATGDFFTPIIVVGLTGFISAALVKLI